MKTAKQLKGIFIDGRFGSGTKFYNYTKELIYEGFTTKDWLEKNLNILGVDKKVWSKILKSGGNIDLAKKLGVYNTLHTFINSSSNETNRRIDSRFEKYRFHLNKKLQEFQK